MLINQEQLEADLQRSLAGLCQKWPGIGFACVAGHENRIQFVTNIPRAEVPKLFKNALQVCEQSKPEPEE